MTEQHYFMDKEGNMKLIEETDIVPDIQYVKEYLPLEDIKEELQYWHNYLAEIETLYNKSLLELRHENKVNLLDLDNVNIKLCNLYSEIHSYYINKQNKNVVKYYNDVDKLYNDHIMDIKELLVMNYLISIEFDYYHKYSLSGKLDTIKNLLTYLYSIY